MAKLPELLTKVNKPKDPNALTDLEKKHLPVIEAPDAVKAGQPFTVTVHVGKLLKHPNEPEHSIEFIELYKGQVFLARADLSAVTVEPKVTFTVSLEPEVGQGDDRLRAYEKCNIHGVWEYDKPIKVQ
jgi:superoxide reductase